MTNTPIADIPVEDYVRELRTLLAGLPRADVTEIIEEVRSHLREQIADCGEADADCGADEMNRGADEMNRGADEPDRAVDDANRAVQAFGTPQEFAVQVMERLGLAPGGPIKDASWPLRAVARTVDVAVGMLPLFPMFFSPVLAIGLIAGPFLGWGGMTPLTSLLVVFYLGLCALWGVWYLRWFPRRGHSGIGMRLTGLSRIRVAGRWRIVSSMAIAESADAKRRARPSYAWLFVAVPVSVFGALFVLSFAGGLVGMAFQPWDWVGQSVDQRQDIERSLAMVDNFYAAVESGDATSAAKFVAPASRSDVARFVSEATAAGVTRHGVGTSELPASVGVWEYFKTPRGEMRRHVTLRIRKTSASKDGRTYIADYTIVDLSRGVREVPADDSETW